MKVLGIGAPIIDHIVDVTDEFLETIPGAKGGMQLVDHTTLQKILSDLDGQATKQLGGSAANTIRALSHLGYDCHFAGKIGNDDEGRMFNDKMQLLGISMLLPAEHLPTSQVACLITPDKERTMRSFVGASGLLEAKDLSPAMFQNAKLVHLEGYTIFKKNLAQTTMKMAKEAGAKISFDLGSFEVVETYRQEILSLLSDYVDIVFGNEEEVRSLTRLDPTKESTVLQGLCETAVLLLGEKGCIARRGEEVVRFPAYPVKAVDSTGAGDFFAGGFLHGYLQGRELKDCARYGSLLGAAVVGTEGVHLEEGEWKRVKKEMKYG